MIDFTNVQVVPIPEDVLTLQRSIVNLEGDRRLLKRILVTLAIGMLIYAVYKIKVQRDFDE